MTKEDILRAYLEDNLFLEKKYLKEGEANKYKWSSLTGNYLIDVIKIAIEGEVTKESSNVTEKKINTLMNRQS
ncbi:hypothetical protein Emtol_2997 [Emticicia oligotrophica DSM 17448]|uniref:Uncharacterized protein n=1 Tax=Emticicia oligotrophica (strain DSM 17448 / CIP 109782 / MTCC 6937 / GPTSA100-15) TaxID=929562 RepID=A0ABM5N409_EMTOG|nr:hypothetical protein [Emticicia oligotrophica]AFK04130.1 hypothetical protein Emtol_2997 [Emticicia oligotrophica DSM 17448]